MTDQKRKRGRPKGSGKKKVVVEPKHRVSYDEFHENITGQYSKAVIDVSPDSEPLPPNWNEMGKIAKLQWLTEHRK